MPQDGAKQKPKFKWMKTFGAWALVPGLGVPATKFVEGYYDVSFQSGNLWPVELDEECGQLAYERRFSTVLGGDDPAYTDFAAVGARFSTGICPV